MRLSAKVQGAARKTAAKSRASLAPVPPDIVVGCRVLVKAVEGEDPLPGLVLFIGETQFAAGTWLGVELDDPKGKNDGTVQGVSYFNARVNHGLFVRAVKVQKIEDKEATGRPTLPAPSSPAQKMPKAFAVGDRVLVRPAENSPGTVRFAGQTKFAEGEWFGVELEKPLGKNDGSVKGVSYFTCPAAHGIFARRDHLTRWDEPTAAALASPASLDVSTTAPVSPVSPASPVEATKASFSPLPDSRVKVMEAELEQLKKELQRYRDAQEVAAVVPTAEVPTRMTKRMKEDFENEIEHFLERRAPLWPSARSGCTGFGAFLREQKESAGLSFRDIAAAAAQQWRDLDEHAREVFREQQAALAGQKKKIKVAAPRAGAFASAVYGRPAALVDTGSDSEYEEEGLTGENEAEARPKAAKAVDLEILGGLIEDYWNSEGADDRTEPFFRFELDESVSKVERCLTGDLHLMSPENDRVGHLGAGVKRFDTVTMKGRDEPLVLLSFNPETLVCKVISDESSFKDPIDKEPSRVGYVTLANLKFQRRLQDREINFRLKESDFYPPEVGDLHRVARETSIVEKVWEDDLTGRFHWSYGVESTDHKAPSTCCTRKGRLVVPMKKLPEVAIREMITEETEKVLGKRKSPEGWCDIPKLWHTLDAGHNQLEVACVSAVVVALAEAAGKRRGGPRRALALDHATVPGKRPRVTVKCTDKAFMCKAGSRFGILKQNALGRDCIDRCGSTIDFFKKDCKYQVRIDNTQDEQEIDARLAKAIQLPQLEYAGGSLLTILLEDGRLVNAQVSRQVEWNRFAIKVDGQDQDQLVELNEANHVQGHCADFDSKAYLKYCAIQRDRFRFLEDSITCRKMDVETQVIYIDTAVESATVQTPDIKSLADLLLGADGERFKGQQLIYRCLMIAGPGTGKTWSSCQLMYHLSKACSARSVLTGIVKMPTLIFAQKIAGMMRAEGVSDVMYNKLPLAAQNAILDKPWLEDGFKIEYGQEYCAVLVRALRLRSAIVLLDGIDEASDVKGVLQSYIMRRLVPMEISLVLTSRPEGVSADLSTLKQSFAIMSLKPLSDKQQKDIILNQVQSEGNEFFEKMMGFADIRAKHDLIYYHEAFPDPKDRRYMEKQLPAVNRFKKEDGSWDPTMVQHLKGQVIKAIPTGTAPSSAYLKAASGYFTGELFRVMDKLLKEKKPTADLDAVLKEKFPGTDAFKPGPSLAKKLYELAEKKKVTNNQDLWSKVVCNTDQLLTAAEDFKPVFEKAVDALCKYVQEELKKTAQEGQQISYDYDLVLGPLKDPVRVCEKAADDYADRFPDFLAESNVVDVIRARLVCTSGSQMKTFLKKISESYETEIEGQKVKLSLARAKNKFSSKDSDPSRFRNVLLNLELSRDGQSHFVELQVHHKLILDFNDESHAHDYYDFFRRELANQYGKEMEASLNFMLEERMLLFKEISEVPVLLSVMTMALLHSNQMPSNLFELYDMGLQNILSSQLGDVTKEDIVEIWRLMQLVALNNQLNQKRIFMQKDVETALVEDKHLLPVWAKFVEKGEVPFVKILADGDDAEYQFRHLSFQEALASQALAEQNQLGLEAAERFKRVGGGFAEFLNIPFYRNMLRIGAGRVGDVFGRYWPLTSSLTDDGRAGLWNLLLGAKKLILASFLRPDASTYKSYEKAAFPPGSEDWFFTIFMFGKPKGNESLMYNLSKIKSQVKNLQAALVTHEACHILFRNQGLDVSAFEVPSIAFPMSWDGHGQALDVSKAPPRIGLQLSFNWKNSLLHFEESEVVCLDPAQPKSQIPDRAPELHRLSGPRWIFVSETPQEPYNFNPCVCTKVIPVYMRGSHCSFLSSSPKLAATSVSGDVKRGQRTEKTGNILAHQAKVQPKTTFTTEWPPPPWRIAASEEVEGVMMSTYQFYHRAAAVEGATEGVESVKVSTRWLAATGGGGNDVMVSTYQSSYELKSSHALSDFVTVPPAGKQRVSEEKYRFHRTEEVIAAAGGHSVGSGFAGGHLEQHYGRVAQVARASRRRQMVATQFLCMRATFLTWRMARGMKDPDPPPEVTEAAASSVAMGESKNETAGDTPALPEVLAEKEGLDDLEAPVSKAKHYEDSGGNAEVFRPKDAEKGLAFLMNLWSRAWNDQGNRLSDFQRVLNEMALPELPPSAPQQLRRWSRRGVAWDFRLEPWPIMQMGIIAPVPKVKDPNDLEAARSEATAKSERIQKKVCSEWALALRGETTKEWSTEFSPWKMLADGVIRDDIILPDQAPAMRCERGHELKLMQTSGGNQCDRCNENDDNQGHNKIHFRCQPCDFDVCIYCAQRIKEAYWKAHAHHDWAAERRDQAMRCACRLSSSSATRVPEELEKPRCPPGRHIYKRTKPGDERCACGREEALYRCENRECQHAICRKCFLREGLRLRRPWDSDTVLEGWQLLPVDAVRLDHPTKKQIMIARRRQAKGKQWQDLFSLRHFRQALNVEFFTHRMEPEKAASFLTKHVDRFQSSSREVRVLEPNKALPPMRRPWPTCQRGHFLDQTQSSTKGRLCNVCGKFAGGYHCSRCQGYKVCRLCYVQMSDRCRAAQRINKENHNEDFLRCLAAKRRLWRTRPEEHVRTSLRGPMPTAFFTHRLEDSEVAACFLKKFQAILVPPSTSTPTATNTEKPKLPEGEQ